MQVQQNIFMNEKENIFMNEKEKTLISLALQ